MTEATAFSSAAQKDSFAELGVERYTWICSFDKDTCEVCGGMDGQVFKMSDYQVGITAPPAHPWCRCCTAPYFKSLSANKAHTSCGHIFRHTASIFLVGRHPPAKALLVWQKICLAIRIRLIHG